MVQPGCFDESQYHCRIRYQYHCASCAGCHGYCRCCCSDSTDHRRCCRSNRTHDRGHDGSTFDYGVTCSTTCCKAVYCRTTWLRYCLRLLVQRLVPTPTNGSVPQGEPWYKKDPSRMTKNQRNKRNKHFREKSRQAARAAMVPGVDYDSYYSDSENSNDDGWTDQLEDYAGPVLFKPDALNEVPYKTDKTAPTDSTPDEPMLD